MFGVCFNGCVYSQTLSNYSIFCDINTQYSHMAARLVNLVNGYVFENVFSVFLKICCVFSASAIEG